MKVKVFGAENCAGCKTVKDILRVSGVEFHYYDVNHHLDMEVASEYGVRSIPTVVIERGGVQRFFVGASKVQIDAMLLKIQGGKV
jgi:glutaredoxin